MPKRYRTFSSPTPGIKASRFAFSKRRKFAAPQLKGRVSKGYTRRSGMFGRFPPQGSELKFFDTELIMPLDTTPEVGTTGATGQLCLIPQGVTESERVGRKCVVKSIQLRGMMRYVPAAAATAATAGFMQIVLDTQANGAACIAADIVDATTMADALVNMNNSERFRTLKRIKKVFNVPAGATTAYNSMTQSVDVYLKCNIPLEFSSTTGAITEIRSNNICILAGSDGIADDTITFTGKARLRFSDS